MVEVADLLGIAQSCLYGWKSRDLVDRIPAAGCGSFYLGRSRA